MENQFLFGFQQIQGWNMSMSPFPPKSPFNATNYAQNVIECEITGLKEF
jgi:hypothetical protein